MKDEVAFIWKVMSIRINETNSDDDVDDIEYLNERNGISTDSASTFEYVENLCSPGEAWKSNDSNESEERDNFSPTEHVASNTEETLTPRRNIELLRSSTKDEKQRQNEEIVVMKSVSASSETGSWESVPVFNQRNEMDLFLAHDRSFGCDESGNRPSTASSSKPCFIDASSLLDESDLIFTPPPSVTHKLYSINSSQRQNFQDGLDEEPLMKHFNIQPEDCSDNENDSSAKVYNIKDQYSANEPIAHKSMSSSGSSTGKTTAIGAISKIDNEKHQGNLIFQHAIPQFSGHSMKISHQFDDHYTSDLSIPSVYSSSSGGGACERLNEFGNGTSSQYNSLCENTSDYNSGSANYSSRLQSDTESLVYPDTPFNSIIQVARQLRVCENNDDLDGKSIARRSSTIHDDIDRNSSSPMRIPRRQKHDESAPILSGGASIKDFTPKQCESPSTRRRNENCPIISGGSVDIEEVVKKIKKPTLEQLKLSSSVTSWIVDFNELHIEEKEDDTTQQPKSLDYSSTSQKNSLGFYVDFNSLKTPEDEMKMFLAKKKLEAKNLDDKMLKKSTGFYVDFSDSCPDTPKGIRTPPTAMSKPRTSKIDKKNVSMFINFNDDKSNSEPSISGFKNVSENTDAKSENESEKKSGCYMFIDSDSPVVKRRQLVKQNDAKRHSWNTNATESTTESKNKYQRSTSVNEKGIMNILDKIPILSKTSSMSIDSSVSPCEDFSCSKSFSSYSNNSVTTSNSSIDQSGTKILIGTDVMTMSAKKRRKDAKLNETFDKSSQGSVTDGILSHEESQASSTDTEDVTFQNPESEDTAQGLRQDLSCSDYKSKMETIPESSENSPFKKASLMKNPSTVSVSVKQEPEFKTETHTMESLQAVIEKQKQILENVTEMSSISFVKLSDLDKPSVPQKFELHASHSSTTNNDQYMSNSTGSRGGVPRFNEHHGGHRSLTSHPWSMSRSTGNNNIVNLASSVENSKSLSRLFPHLSKGNKFVVM